MTNEQRERLRTWGGMAVNHLHDVASRQYYPGDKTALREVADELCEIVKELVHPSRQTQEGRKE